MKFCSNHSQLIIALLLLVSFFSTGSFLVAQQNIIKTGIPEPSGFMETLLQKFPVLPGQEREFPSLKSLRKMPVNTDVSVKKDSIYTYDFVSDNDSSLSQKTIYFYNNNVQMVRTLICLWDKQEQFWAYEKKQEYTYDEYGYTTSRSDYQYWDNESWQIVSRNEFVYDSVGNLLMDASYFLFIDELEGTNKNTFTYYPNGLRKSYSSYTWDTNNKIWINRTRSDYTYNDKALLETRISSDGDESGSNWIPVRKEEFEYNDAGQQISENFYYYSTSNDEWDLTQKDSTFYDTINYLSETFFYGLNPNKTEWVYSAKRMKTCLSSDENHCVTISYVWDPDVKDWVLANDSYKEIRNEILLPSGGYQRSRFIYNWDSISAQWKSSIGYSLSYDSWEHRTSYTPYSQAFYNDTLFSPHFHDTASYNPDGLLIFQASYRNWDSDQSIWGTGSKTEFAYNESQLLIYSLSWELPNNPGWIRKSSDTYYNSDFVLPDTSIYFSNDTLYAALENADTYQWFDCQSGEDIEDADRSWYSSTTPGTFSVRITTANYIVSSSCYNVVLSVNSPKNEIIKCYPNPTTGLLHLDFDSAGMPELICTLTNLTGRQVRTFSIPGNSSHISIDLSGLTTGIYFLRIMAGNHILQTQKISIF